MSKELDVYLHRSLVGNLQQDRHGRISFAYDKGWLENGSSVPLSHSLPLAKEPYPGKHCQGFFAGVLPEEENRKLISAILGISARNDFALLEQIGGECAGAVSFQPRGTPLPDDRESYQKLDEQGLHSVLEELPKRPLMAGYGEVRLSLAGAQNKLAVHIADGVISLPLYGSPSTHILKPAIPRFPGLVQNEAFCMRLAYAVGLPVPDVSIGKNGVREYLLIERYDRITEADNSLTRLHQEDFCQALGLPPHLKYQNEGGPSLAHCFELVREVSSAPAPDLLHLLDAVVFNFLIGNHDAHGKNFSFLRETENRSIIRLAPFYDLVSTICYSELSGKMAMKIGSRYLPNEVRLRHWQTLWQSAGFSEGQAKKRTLAFTDRLVDLVSNDEYDNATEEAVASHVNSRAILIRRALS